MEDFPIVENSYIVPEMIEAIHLSNLSYIFAIQCELEVVPFAMVEYIYIILFKIISSFFNRELDADFSRSLSESQQTFDMLAIGRKLFDIAMLDVDVVLLVQ